MPWHFEWDEKKRYQVLSKHGVDFVDVAQALASSWWYEYPRPYHRRGELRWDALIEWQGIVLFATLHYRGKNTIRLITARRAEAHERQTFYHHRPV